MLATLHTVPCQKIIRETPSPTPAPSVVKPTRPVSEPLPPTSAVTVAQPPTGPINAAERVYTNRELGFQITFPETWRITDEDFGEYARSQGYDLSLKAPNELSGVSRVRLDRALENVTVLLTAYRADAGAKEGAILRVSTEDVTRVPQVRDAVDYFDLMRSQFATVKLPADFKYSETQAEKLGKKQFAFLDTSSATGKKRLYATVKKGQAIMFTLTYFTGDDLRTMRQILAAGDFNVK